MSALTAPRDDLGGDAGGRVGADAPDATIVYDGQCPFCSRYVQLVRLRRAIGSVKLVDARKGGPLVEQLTAAGFDLDEGMVLKLGDRLYHGDECIHMLSLLSTPSDSFNKINRLIFRSRRASSLLYPMLRAGRNLVLAALGRTKIRDLKS